MTWLLVSFWKKKRSYVLFYSQLNGQEEKIYSNIWEILKEKKNGNKKRGTNFHESQFFTDLEMYYSIYNSPIFKMEKKKRKKNYTLEFPQKRERIVKDYMLNADAEKT